jgi:hypothetical protein
MATDLEKGPATVIETEIRKVVEEKVDSAEECLGGFLKRLRSFWWWIFGALILALPFALAASIFRYVRIGPISMAGLFFWLELSWLALWALYFGVWCVGMAWHWLCRRLEPLDISDYRDSLDNVKAHLTLFLWTIVSWAIVPALCYFDGRDYIIGWVSTFQTVLLGMLISSAILFAKCLVVEVVLTKAAVRFRSHWRKNLVRSKEIVEFLLQKEKEQTIWKSIHRLTMYPALNKTEKYLQGRGDEASYKAVRVEILEKIRQKPMLYSDLSKHIESLGVQRGEDVAEDITWFVEDTGKGLEAAWIGEESIKKSVGHLNIILTVLALPGIAIVFGILSLTVT